jgi:hypothetical protein
MNTRVQAEVLTLGVIAEMVNPKTLVVINVIDSNPYLTKAICLPHIKISINGHSLSGVNPEDLLIGGTTTLAMA